MAVSCICALQHMLKCKMETKVFVNKWTFIVFVRVPLRADTFDKLLR